MGCLCQWELKAPADRSQSDWVHEQVAKADCECSLYDAWIKKGDEVVECDLIIICEHEIAVGGMRNISRPDGDCCYRYLLGIQA